MDEAKNIVKKIIELTNKRAADGEKVAAILEMVWGNSGLHLTENFRKKKKKY